MTLRRTIQRRVKRTRAKQRQRERDARWAEMSPAARAIVKRNVAMTLDLMQKQLSMVSLVNRPFPGDVKSGATVSVRLPRRFER